MITTAAPRRPNLAAWRMVALLVTGYAGYYLCRSNLSVSMPLIVQDFAAGRRLKRFVCGLVR
jgi:sugar phosphate permease